MHRLRRQRRELPLAPRLAPMPRLPQTAPAEPAGPMRGDLLKLTAALSLLAYAGGAAAVFLRRPWAG